MVGLKRGKNIGAEGIFPNTECVKKSLKVRLRLGNNTLWRQVIGINKEKLIAKREKILNKYPHARGFRVQKRLEDIERQLKELES